MFIQWIPSRFETVYLYSLAETYPAILSILTSGSYSPIPFAEDNFDIYSTGFRVSFSGSGYWNGSGQTLSYNYQFYESFDNYPTGSFYGFYTGLNSGQTISGYSEFIGLSTGTFYEYGNSGIIVSRYLYALFDNYSDGYFSNLDITGTSIIETTYFTGYENTPPYTFSTNTQTGFLTGSIISTGYSSGSIVTKYAYDMFDSYQQRYYYNMSLVATNITITDSWQSYNGTSYYIATTGATTGFVNGETYTTGIESPIFSLLYGADNFITSRTNNPTLLESFIYPINVSLTNFDSGISFFDYLPYTYQIYNYSGKGGFLT